MLHIHITPGPEQKAAANNACYYSPKYYFELLFLSSTRDFFCKSEKSKELLSLHCFLEHRLYIKLEDLYFLVIQKSSWTTDSHKQFSSATYLNNTTAQKGKQ